MDFKNKNNCLDTFLNRPSFSLLLIYILLGNYIQLILILIYYLVTKNWYFTEKTIALIYGQRKNFFELKKVLLIKKKFLRSKKIDLFTLKIFFLIRQNYLQFKEIFFYRISKKCFFDSKKLFSGCWKFKFYSIIHSEKIFDCIKKIICLNHFLWCQEMFCFNETKFVWFKQNIFGSNKYWFESNKFLP